MRRKVDWEDLMAAGFPAICPDGSIQRWRPTLSGPDFVGAPAIFTKAASVSGHIITKSRSDTSLLTRLCGDLVPDAGNTRPYTFYAGCWVDGVNRMTQGIVGLPGEDITFWMQSDLMANSPPGDYIFDLMIGSTGGVGAWQFGTAWEWLIWERPWPSGKAPPRVVV